MRKKKIQDVRSFHARSKLQFKAWHEVDVICAKIYEQETIRDNILKVYNDKELQDRLDGKIAELRRQRDEMLRKIDEDRKAMATQIGVVWTCANLMATVCDEFADVFKRLTGIDSAKLGTTTYSEEAVKETRNLVDNAVAIELLWEQMGAMVDEVKDWSLSTTFADVSDRFEARAVGLLNDLKADLEKKFTRQLDRR